MVTHQSYLNMVPDESNTPIIHVSQYDSNFSIKFYLIAVKGEFVPAYPTAVENNVTFTVESGTTAEIRGTKTDGNGYSANATINTSEKSVTVTGHQQMTAVAGKCVYEIVLKYNNKEISSANFILDVERAALDSDTITSDSVIKELVNVIDRTDELILAAAQTEERVQQAEDAAQQAENAAQAAQDISGYAAEVLELAQHVGESIEEIRTAKTASQSAASSASQSASSASTSASNASGSASQAATSASNASTYASRAQTSAASASTSANTAKSWAVGPNGSGSGTDTNNSKYYAEQAAASAATMADRVLWWSSQAIASTSGASGTLLTITDSRITADHVLDKFMPSNPSAITSDVTCTTSAGQAVFTGVSTSAITAEIMLSKKDN